MSAPGIRCAIRFKKGLWAVYAVEDRNGPIIAEEVVFGPKEDGLYISAFGIRENALRYVAQAGWEVVS